ncbi:MAG: serine/threonine-protein kinase [Myxococcota bacterium]
MAVADAPIGKNMGPMAGQPPPPTDGGRPRYELLRVVNRGGMGEIALAKAVGTKGFEKLVVLKRLRADAERDDHIAMFDVEQEVMSRLEHPNIVKVFDQPVVDGVPYMAMEYVRGRNLDQLVRAANHLGEALPLQYCLTVISEVLRGLAFVHRLKDAEGRALGVVHQDMTPSNVMVSFFGEVKITDFGISYVTSRDGGLRKGVLKGKPRYVAPEVLAGKRVNNTADIYGVGVVLFEMLTGRALFARQSVKETLSAVARNELPSLRDDLGQFGAGVVALMERALCKAPRDRYRTAEEMGADVVTELSKVNGEMPPAHLGFHTRKYFASDPDVPEVDPALERAIRIGAAPRPDLEPKDLESTLLELDKLLGEDDSIDLFSVPDELQPDLRELQDMEPFQAHTPLPEFIWDAKSDEEILEKAGVKLTASTAKEVVPSGEYPNAPGKTPFVAEPTTLDAPPPRYPAAPPRIGAVQEASSHESALSFPPLPKPLTPRPDIAAAPVAMPAPQPVEAADSATIDTRPAPAPQTRAKGSSVGYLVTFVLGVAVGLAAGAMLYAAFV